MNRRTRILILALAAVALVAAIVAVTAFASRGERETVTVRRGSLEVTIETVGRLMPRNPIDVRSAVAGQVRLVAAREGDAVQAGDVLVELDPGPLRDALDRAQQQLTAAETALNLAEQSGGDEPTAQQLADRLAAEQRVREARAALDQARAALASSLVLAPASGTVLSIEAVEGAPVAQGAPLARIADLGNLQLEVDLDEIDLPHVTPGAGVTFALDAYPGQEIEGTLERVSPVAETSGGTTTFKAVVTFSTPEGLILRPGMNANVSIETAVRDNVLLVPDGALRTVGRRTFVDVVTDGGVEEREIQTGLRSNGMVEVASGLVEGDRVVVQRAP